jgi:uncharacterized repeat protein (TIGR04052 family)
MKIIKCLLSAAALALLLTGCIVATNTTGDVTLQFALTAAGEPVACGQTYPDFGTAQNSIELLDARFYLSNIRLISMDGAETPLQLTPDDKWQSDQVALLDFEDGSALCADGGTAETNHTVKGTVTPGYYTGIAFDMGVPFDLNHQDVTAASAPLNVPALWWNWQYGYKHARIDLRTDVAENNTFFVHIGSTGCDAASPEQSPATACTNPNLVSVRLTGFNPTTSVITADLTDLLANVNLSENAPEPPGCMSMAMDPDCTHLFPNLGLTLMDGGVNDVQHFFRLTTAQ